MFMGVLLMNKYYHESYVPELLLLTNKYCHESYIPELFNTKLARKCQIKLRRKKKQKKLEN